jgi:hypothetical protein
MSVPLVARSYTASVRDRDLGRIGSQRRFERLRRAERALRERTSRFRAADRISREEAHERRASRL